MSYNISRFHVKRLVNLRIPMSAFYIHERSDWHPSPHLKDVRECADVTLDCGEVEIKGDIHDGFLFVESMELSGEGSGTFMNWIMLPALKESTGELAATCIYEDGDSIIKLLVENGQVDEIEIDIADI